MTKKNIFHTADKEAFFLYNTKLMIWIFSDNIFFCIENVWYTKVYIFSEKINEWKKENNWLMIVFNKSPIEV